MIWRKRPIRSVERLEVHSGDTIVITLRADVNQARAALWYDQVKAGVPEDVKVLVLAGGAEMAVLAYGARRPRALRPSIVETK